MFSFTVLTLILLSLELCHKGPQIFYYVGHLLSNSIKSLSTESKIYILQLVACFASVFIRCCYDFKKLKAPIFVLFNSICILRSAKWTTPLLCNAIFNFFKLSTLCVTLPALGYFFSCTNGSFMLTYLLGGDYPFVVLEPADSILNVTQQIYVVYNSADTPIMAVKSLLNNSFSDAESISEIEAHLKSATYTIKPLPEPIATPSNLMTFAICSFLVTATILGFMIFNNS